MMPSPLFFNAHTHKRTDSSASELLNIFAHLPASSSVSRPYSIGLHPWHISQQEAENQDFIANIIADKNALAIGECGLDRLCQVPMPLQLHFFEQQADIALRLRLPLIIHSVRAYDLLLQCRKNFGYQSKWIVHGFAANRQIAEALLDKEVMLSFGKSLLRPQTSLQATFAHLPDEMLFLETDDDINLTINDLYHHAAALKNCSTSSLKAILWENALRTFGQNLLISNF